MGARGLSHPLGTCTGEQLGTGLSHSESTIQSPSLDDDLSWESVTSPREGATAVSAEVADNITVGIRLLRVLLGGGAGELEVILVDDEVG